MKLDDNEIASLSIAEFLVTRLYLKLEINSFNEIMISKRFNSNVKNLRLIFTFITREIDIAISELSLVYVVDSHPKNTVEEIKKYKWILKRNVVCLYFQNNGKDVLKKLARHTKINFQKQQTFSCNHE